MKARRYISKRKWAAIPAARVKTMKRIVLLVFMLILAAFGSSWLWGSFGTPQAVPDAAEQEASDTAPEVRLPLETQTPPPAVGSEAASAKPSAAPQSTAAPAATAAPSVPAAPERTSTAAAPAAPDTGEATGSQTAAPSYGGEAREEDEGELVPLF